MKDDRVGYLYSIFTPYQISKGVYGTAIKIGFTEQPRERFKSASTFIGDFDQEEAYIGKPVYGVRPVHEDRAHAKFWKYNLQYRLNPERVGRHKEVYYKNEEMINFSSDATLMDILGLPGTTKEFTSWNGVFSSSDFCYSWSFAYDDIKKNLVSIIWEWEHMEESKKESWLIKLPDRYSSILAQLGIEKIKEVGYNPKEIWKLLYEKKSI